jgi:hypothetical protein
MNNPTQVAIDRAYEAAPDSWKEQAWELCLSFAARMSHSGETWTAEQLRRYCADRGLPDREPRAFGGILQSLSRDGCIVASGWEETSNPRAHKRLVRKWRSL